MGWMEKWLIVGWMIAGQEHRHGTRLVRLNILTIVNDISAHNFTFLTKMLKFSIIAFDKLDWFAAFTFKKK